MVVPIVFGVAFVVHGVLVLVDFHGYFLWVARHMKYSERRWRYKLGEGRYGSTQRRWSMSTTPQSRWLFGGWSIFVGVIAVIAGFVGHAPR